VDETLLSIATSLLVSLFELKNSVRQREEHSAESVEKLLKLPFNEHLDSDAFLDVLSVVSVHLQDETILLQVVQHKKVHLVWDILLLTEDVMSRESDQGEEVDEQDEKQCKSFISCSFCRLVYHFDEYLSLYVNENIVNYQIQFNPMCIESSTCTNAPLTNIRPQFPRRLRPKSSRSVFFACFQQRVHCGRQFHQRSL